MHSQPTDASLDSLPPHSTFADLLADIADAFSNCIDTDGAAVLLHACLEVTDARYGTVYLGNVAGRFELAASTQCAHGRTLPGIVTDTLVSLRPAIWDNGASPASLAVPLRSRGRVLGVVALELPADHTRNVQMMNAVQSLADLAAATIDHARTIDHTSRLVGQLQSALDNRVVLEQAKGMVAERLGIDCRAAFVEIRNRARREQRAIGDVASDIVGSRSSGDSAP